MNSNIYLYGAGNIGKRIYDIYKKRGIEIVAFLDANIKNSAIDNKKILDPFACLVDTKDSTVIVSIFNRDVDFLALKNKLYEVGFDEVLSFFDIYKDISNEFGDWYWLSSDTDFLSDENVRFVINILSDNISHDTFAETVKARKENTYPYVSNKYPIEEQYVSKDLPLRKYDNFIDVGAYDGDTLVAMDKINFDIPNIYAFEPDVRIFQRLADTVRKLNKKAILFPNGVYSNNEIATFAADGGEGGCIVNDNAIQYNTIQNVALDDVFINNLKGITLLKMDIEGAEMEALKGAKNLITNSNMDLAICVYHKPNDIIEIPKYINKLGNFNFYLRQYGFYGIDLVLFAFRK
ncbi:MAG: FkbM family methyltransferase [Bacteroidales bacterium]|jgi:FkbM family methyltransferase|nr:FkbM family methyltransferase [Bacteroidales bacterium]